MIVNIEFLLTGKVAGWSNLDTSSTSKAGLHNIVLLSLSFPKSYLNGLYSFGVLRFFILFYLFIYLFYFILFFKTWILILNYKHVSFMTLLFSYFTVSLYFSTNLIFIQLNININPNIMLVDT